MHGNLPVFGNRTIDCAAANGSEELDTAANGSDSTKWFPDAARVLLGKDAGLHLHYITGYPERSCYYYAKGDRPPPMDFLWCLFRSPQGGPFLRAFMHGCDAQHWRDIERAERIAVQIDKLDLAP